MSETGDRPDTMVVGAFMASGVGGGEAGFRSRRRVVLVVVVEEKKRQGDDDMRGDNQVGKGRGGDSSNHSINPTRAGYRTRAATG